jgi:6-phosphogluconate dehydrogenase
MKLGMIGLGRMGAGMTERLERNGHTVQTYDPRVESTADSLEELVSQLEPPRVLWMMVPSGQITQETFDSLLELAGRDDVIVDGGNSNWRDSQAKHADAKEQGIHFVDVGVSGGIWGLEVGFCLMAGGEDEPVSRVTPVFEALAPENGWAHVGEPGGGHFTKMIHNGIEYGLMQAYAEGFEIMHRSAFSLDLSEIAGIWRYGSVVRSWLLELLHQAMEEHGDDLGDIAPYVEDSGEGRWTIDAAIAENVPAPVISAALFARFSSRQDYSFAAKVAAALRNQFGGHAIRAVEEAKAAPDPR